jgi:uncharacterized HAD superfamily protein
MCALEQSEKGMNFSMKIGIDLDGVVIDSETTFRTYEELYDIEILKSNNLVNREEPKFQARYNWTKEQQNEFAKKYFLKVSKESGLMSGFISAYNYLKRQGHQFVVITARGLTPDGTFMKEMEDDAKRVLQESNILFDKYYWGQRDKLEVCQKEHIDIMIDDDWKIIKRLSENQIKTLYFRDTNLKALPNSKFIQEVNNWGDICRCINN